MSEHTKEPWILVDTEDDTIEITTEKRNGLIIPIAEVSTGFDGQIGIEQEANPRRIVACVNACEGIPTGVLEKQGMVPIEQVTHDIEQQRDKLLAALTGLVDDLEMRAVDGVVPCGRSAYAKAKSALTGKPFTEYF